MSFRKLTKMCDERIRTEMGDFYFISKNKMDDLLSLFERQTVRIKELTEIISDQQEQLQEQLKNLQNTEV